MTEPVIHHRFYPWSGVGPTQHPSGSWGEPVRWNEEAGEEGMRILLEADPFDLDLDDSARRQLFELMASTPRITWMVTTENADIVDEVAPSWKHAWPHNVWVGVRIAKPSDAERHIYGVLDLPAPVRFALCEPLAQPLDLRWVFNPRSYACCGRKETCHGTGSCPLGSWPREDAGRFAGLDWVIAGPELGATARPMHPDWARTLRDDCKENKVPFYFTGMGEWQVIHETQKVGAALPPCGDGERYLNLEGFAAVRGPKVVVVRQVGQLFTGHELDGALHTEFPTPKVRGPVQEHAMSHAVESRARP